MTPPRTAELVLVGPDRRLVGVLPPVVAELPWWQEARDVVHLVRERDGVDVVVLRLLRTELPAMPGGAVVYLAQVGADDAERLRGALPPVPDDLAALALSADERRAAYAEVGGPGASLAWAAAELGGLADAHQQRTWNLSSLWRLTASDGRSAWLKQVPQFFAHEAAVLAWLGDRLPGWAPPLLAAGEPGRQLLGHVEGTDLYDAGVAERVAIARRAHTIQLTSRADVDELVAAGVPERRGGLLADWVLDTLGARADGHPARALLDRLADDVDVLESCGLPAVLVHGDEHDGNVVDAGDRLVVLDWGDAFVGNPVFDIVTLAGGPTYARSEVLDAWCELWRASVPGCDPERALVVGRRVAALRSAAVYADFLDRIEDSEAVFHRADVPALLDQAVALAGLG